MLLLSYILLPLKQLLRMKMALFFTLIFPVVLYLVNGHANEPIYLIIFFNFAMQSCMLQSVGIFISSQRSTSWGNYLSTLPAPLLYPILGVIISMFIVGICGVLLISGIELFFYHTLPFNKLGLALLSTSLGAIPMGALGYLVGVWFDQMTARSILTFANLLFLFLTFAPPFFKNILAYVSLPNAWLNFSQNLVIDSHFNVISFSVLLVYFFLSILFIKIVDKPKSRYTDV